VDFASSQIATPDVGATEPSLSIGFSGGSWPEAAHAANFADSTHLTRTCRRKFGLAPPLCGSRNWPQTSSRRTLPRRSEDHLAVQPKRFALRQLVLGRV
jgi:hypothetical protein